MNKSIDDIDFETSDEIIDNKRKKDNTKSSIETLSQKT